MFTGEQEDIPITPNVKEEPIQSGEDLTPFSEQTGAPRGEEVENEGSSEEDPWDEVIPNEEVPDEEVPEESDEPPDVKYRIENPLSNGNAFVAAGDQAQLHQYTTYHHVTNRYDHLQIVLDSKHPDIEAQEDIFRDVRDLLKQTLALARQSSIVPRRDARPEDAPLPATHDEFSNWFYKHLDEYEQCYAQAAALLHGMSANEVSKRADELYLLYRIQQNNTSLSTSPSSDVLPDELHSSLLSHHNKPSKDLQDKTYTITQRIDGVERLYWQDVQTDGTSTFHLQFLDFLAGEYLSKGLQGQTFLKQVQAWAQENNSEQFQCVTRAFGVFLWHQSRKALREQATEWAKKPSANRWQRTAILLDAAYEIDLIRYPEHEHDETASPTLHILSEWVERTQAMTTKTNVYQGCAAADTYALIGKRKLKTALSGLESLLHITSEDLQEIEKLQAAVISAYFRLSWSVDIHCVICHLSFAVEQSLLQSAPRKTAHQRRIYRLQCQLRLNVSLDAFFFIALDSLSGSKVTRAANYYEELLFDVPSVAERQKRDVILAGVLVTNDHRKLSWRKEVIALMGAAIIEKSSQESAFDLLARWADALLCMEDASSHQGSQLIASFQTFVVEIGQLIDRWSRELHRQNRRSPALPIYKRHLAIWSKKRDAFGRLFQKVANQVSSL